MNKNVKWAAGLAASLSLAGTFSATSILANAATPKTNNHMMSGKMQVSQVYPASTKQVDLVCKDAMTFQGKTITLRATHTMGLTPMGSTLTATYDAMNKGFVLNGGKMLSPGVTYAVSANWARIPMSKATFTVPDVLRVKQISKNQLEVVYDKRVDAMTAMTPGNYWIKSNQMMATGIAELGMNDKVTPTNGLTKMDVSIHEKGMAGRIFIFTFKANISAGVKYTLIPCNVGPLNDGHYMGPNFTASSATTFVGQKKMM